MPLLTCNRVRCFCNVLAETLSNTRPSNASVTAIALRPTWFGESVRERNVKERVQKPKDQTRKSGEIPNNQPDPKWETRRGDTSPYQRAGFQWSSAASAEIGSD